MQCVSDMTLVNSYLNMNTSFASPAQNSILGKYSFHFLWNAEKAVHTIWAIFTSRGSVGDCLKFSIDITTRGLDIPWTQSYKNKWMWWRTSFLFPRVKWPFFAKVLFESNFFLAFCTGASEYTHNLLQTKFKHQSKSLENSNLLYTRIILHQITLLQE